MGKEVTTKLCCEVAVDRKIVPFERVPDHAGGDYSASLCGVHLTPPVFALGQALSHAAVSLVNFLVAFNTMSLSPLPNLNVVIVVLQPSQGTAAAAGTFLR